MSESKVKIDFIFEQKQKTFDWLIKKECQFLVLHDNKNINVVSLNFRKACSLMIHTVVPRHFAV